MKNRKLKSLLVALLICGAHIYGSSPTQHKGDADAVKGMEENDCTSIEIKYEELEKMFKSAPPPEVEKQLKEKLVKGKTGYRILFEKLNPSQKIDQKVLDLVPNLIAMHFENCMDLAPQGFIDIIKMKETSIEHLVFKGCGKLINKGGFKQFIDNMKQKPSKLKTIEAKDIKVEISEKEQFDKVFTKVKLTSLS
jgi:hypothetical protein